MEGGSSGTESNRSTGSIMIFRSGQGAADLRRCRAPGCVVWMRPLLVRNGIQVLKLRYITGSYLRLVSLLSFKWNKQLVFSDKKNVNVCLKLRPELRPSHRVFHLNDSHLEKCFSLRHKWAFMVAARGSRTHPIPPPPPLCLQRCVSWNDSAQSGSLKRTCLCFFMWVRSHLHGSSPVPVLQLAHFS